MSDVIPSNLIGSFKRKPATEETPEKHSDTQNNYISQQPEASKINRTLADYKDKLKYYSSVQVKFNNKPTQETTARSTLETTNSTASEQIAKKTFSGSMVISYIELPADKRDIITYDQFIQTVDIFKTQVYMPEKNAISFVQGIIKTIDNRYNFDSCISRELIEIKQSHQQKITNNYQQLSDINKSFITKEFYQDNILYLCKQKNSMFHIACEEVQKIATQARSLNDFTILMKTLMTKDESAINMPQQNTVFEASCDMEDQKITDSNQAYASDYNAKALAKCTNDISLSPMANLGQTCWFNTAFKNIPNIFSFDVTIKAVTKLIKKQQILKTSQSIATIKVLEKLKIIFTDLSYNKPIDNQIMDLFDVVYDYSQIPNIAQNNHDDPIKQLANIIKPAFIEEQDNVDFTVNLNIFTHGSRRKSYAKIPAHDAVEFMVQIIELLELMKNENQLLIKTTRQYKITKENLANMGIYGVNEDLIIVKPATKNHCITYKEFDEQINEIEISREILADVPVQGNNIQLINALHNNMGANIKIPAETKISEELVACVGSIKEIMFDTVSYKQDTVSYKQVGNEFVVDSDKTLRDFRELVSNSSLVVIDQDSGQKYCLSLELNSIILRMGNGLTGHYMLVSKDNNNNLFLQNDRFNCLLEDAYVEKFESHEKELKVTEFKAKGTLDQLIIYMLKDTVYPINTSFKVKAWTKV